MHDIILHLWENTHGYFSSKSFWIISEVIFAMILEGFGAHVRSLAVLSSNSLVDIVFFSFKKNGGFPYSFSTQPSFQRSTMWCYLKLGYPQGLKFQVRCFFLKKKFNA